jgi:hypothetical protein
MMKLTKQTNRRMTRRLGWRGKGRTTKYAIEFEIRTPLDYFDPREDEVFLIDLLDHISYYSMDFHDIPGWKLNRVKINGTTVINKTI